MKRLLVICLILLFVAPGCAVYTPAYGYAPAYSYPYYGYGYRSYPYPGYSVGPPIVGFGWRPGWSRPYRPGWDHFGHHRHFRR